MSNAIIVKKPSFSGITEIADPSDIPILILEPASGEEFKPKKLDLLSPLKIGRKVKAPSASNNGIFDSKVLSRQHAEIFHNKGKVWIKDVKSSNGTYLNGTRLSEEGMLSAPYALKANDLIDFGIDINDGDGGLLYRKVSCKVSFEYSNLAGSTIPSPVDNAESPTMYKSPAELAKLIDQEIAKSEALNAELQGLRTQLLSVQPTVTLLKTQLEESKSQTKIWQDKFESLVPLLEDYDVIVKSNELLVIQQENTRTGHSKTCADFDEKVDALCNQLSESKALLQYKEEQLKLSSENVESITHDHMKCADIIESLSTNLASLEVAHTEHKNDHEDALRVSQNTVIALEAKVDILNERLASPTLASSIDDKVQLDNLDRISVLEMENSNLITQLELLLCENKSSAASLETFKCHSEASDKQLASRVALLENDLNESSKRLVEENARFTALSQQSIDSEADNSKKIAAMTENLEMLQTNIDSLQTEKLSKQSSIEKSVEAGSAEFLSRIGRLETENSRISKQLADITEQSKAESEISCAGAEILKSRYASDIDALQLENADLVNQNEAAILSVKDIESRNEGIMASATELQTRVSQLELDINILQSKLKDLSLLKEALDKELEASHRDTSLGQSNINAAAVESETLKSEISRLEEICIELEAKSNHANALQLTRLAKQTADQALLEKDREGIQSELEDFKHRFAQLEMEKSSSRTQTESVDATGDIKSSSNESKIASIESRLNMNGIFVTSSEIDSPVALLSASSDKGDISTEEIIGDADRWKSFTKEPPIDIAAKSLRKVKRKGGRSVYMFWGFLFIGIVGTIVTPSLFHHCFYDNGNVFQWLNQK